jgi:hypothetical protein
MLGQFGVHRASQHWHSCTPAEAAGNVTRKGTEIHTTGPVSFAVQGLVTDQLAQMIFHRVLGPRPPRTRALAATTAAVAAATAAAEPVRPGLKVCLECPPSLVPFTIKPKADLSCHDGIPVGEVKAHVTPPALDACPGWCRRQPPASFIQTNSGPVEVRDCREEGPASTSNNSSPVSTTTPTMTTTMPIRELIPRGGWPELFSKLAGDKGPVNVAFLGGSITEKPDC